MTAWITTYTGRHVDPVQPDPEQLVPEDIAHALSLICRGNGHVKTFYSVGQHCIACAREALARGYSRRVALGALLHDASECYLSDVPSPFKRTLKGYREQEDALLDLIFTKFLGSPLTEEESRQVFDIDRGLLGSDLRQLLNEEEVSSASPLLLPVDYTVLPFAQVEQTYLELFHKMQNPFA
ncbi:hypothetical protein LQE88_02615 [Acidaminococcus sp. NSJ-142]|uniref:hypothetical protein n=1 Tax=Acidaminococcus TaxID=904 RepID=UPI000E4A12B0|nr:MULTISPECIES: hypothetical protein [Acidaminococcus]MCD2434889.1 hypothetical protein [Acidaminococcus hominis]RHK02323.1 hypothetical protein DW089_04160 [Acidaminococcus sp. AM05-11]